MGIEEKQTSPKRVAIIGSGNWGSAIARIVGKTTSEHPELFLSSVHMWVRDEVVEGKSLVSIINDRHENVKYLPGKMLPSNVIAIGDIDKAVEDADILIFVLPHQFITSVCSKMKGKLKENVKGISLVKGFEKIKGGGIKLISSLLKESLQIPISVLMGANIAHEVADDMFCETTIGCSGGEDLQKIYKQLFSTPNFRVVVVKDETTVEICGALKNIVAVGAGLVDGMKMGDNTKAAVIRLGLMEMIRFTELFFSTEASCVSTFFESCGVADLVTTCYGGRNRKVAEAFVTSKKSIAELEKELLGGQKLQGPETAAEVNIMLQSRKMEDQFPLFTSVHRICTGESGVVNLIESLRSHPEHMVKANVHL
uniref:Glycerol-3-phosphate dehydrogenase [NAD(+)] n=1 Tax=Caligus rogercresseyi TaxID=217165 RepID=C1BQN2_CALRO|nr:Glycerol-3-phosphate dehydrogenase, cytoplasmic [Caligus rogercresseyi]